MSYSPSCFVVEWMHDAPGCCLHILVSVDVVVEA